MWQVSIFKDHDLAAIQIFCLISTLHSINSLLENAYLICGDWFLTRKNRTFTSLLAGKFVLIMNLLVGTRKVLLEDGNSSVFHTKLGTYVFLCVGRCNFPAELVSENLLPSCRIHLKIPPP